MIIKPFYLNLFHNKLQFKCKMYLTKIHCVANINHTHPILWKNYIYFKRFCNFLQHFKLKTNHFFLTVTMENELEILMGFFRFYCIWKSFFKSNLRCAFPLNQWQHKLHYRLYIFKFELSRIRIRMSTNCSKYISMSTFWAECRGI